MNDQPRSRIGQCFANASPILDRQTLSAAAEGDADVEQALLAAFRESLRELSTTLHRAVEVHDMTTISRAAHGLKGEATQLGASRIAETAASLEEASNRFAAEECDALFASLREEVEAFRQVLAEI